MSEQTSQESTPPPVLDPLNRDSLNLPNLITVGRLVLAVILFALIDIGEYWVMSAALFVTAAATDWVDGWLARKYGQVTALGRILDPFADKLIIGGVFVFLLEKNGSREGLVVLSSGVNAWMAIIVIGREMFVSSLRGFLEQHGRDFSATLSGKAKMLLQCMAVTASLLSLSPDLSWPWLVPVRDILLWVAVVVTAYSGAVYIVRASQLMKAEVK